MIPPLLKSEPNTSKPEPVLLTKNEAAEMLRLSPSTIRALERNGHLRAVRIGRSVRFLLDDLRDFAHSMAANSSSVVVQR